MLSTVVEKEVPTTQPASTYNATIVPPRVSASTTPVMQPLAKVTTANDSAGTHFTQFGPPSGPPVGSAVTTTSSGPLTGHPGGLPVGGLMVEMFASSSAPPTAMSAAQTTVTTAAVALVTSSVSVPIEQPAPPGLSDDEQEAT